MNRPADDDLPPTEPIPPGDNECCGSGCDPCVFDVYNEARRRYLAELQAWRQRQAARDGPRDPAPPPGTGR